MDTTDPIDLGPAGQRLADLVASIKDDEVGKPTPCPAYTLGDLVEHVGGLALAFTAAAKKDRTEHSERGPSGDASQLPADWRTRIPRDLTALVQAWRQLGAWTGMTRIAGSDAPSPVVGISAAAELVVHGWDIARATGRPYDPDPASVEAARSFLTMIASPDAPAGLEVPFGPSRTVPHDAPPLDCVLALAGRDPGWVPSSGDRHAHVLRFLDQEVWRRIPEDQLGRRLGRREEDEILGYGPDSP